MKSKLLESVGLSNYISGTNYNFRYKTVGPKVCNYMDEILHINNMYPKNIYSCFQIHSNRVENINHKDFQDFPYGKILLDTDGLICDEKNVVITTKFADCTPIILFDPVKKIQASVHSGWRGTAQKISEVAINKLVSEYNCNVKDLYAFVGPSIDADLYEVGSDVYEAFSSFKNRDSYFKKKDNGKFLLDMKSINKDILIDNGILNNHIEVSDLNTFTNKNLHSARRDNPDYGLNIMITMIK